MAIGNVLAELFVKIGADTAGLKQGLGDAEKSVDGLGAAFEKHRKGIGIAMTAIGGAIVGTAVMSLKAYSDMGDEIQKMAIKTGLSTEALSEWRYMADLGGTSLGAVEKGIKAMANTLEGAKDGLSTSAKAFEKIGVSLEDLKGKSPEEIFNILTTAVANVEDPLQRSALAMDIFGKSGTDLLPILDQGAEGMAKQRQEAHDLGVVFDQEAANKAANFQDANEKLMTSLNGIKMVIADKLIPVLMPLIEGITNIIKKIGDWMDAHPELTKVILIVVGAIGALFVVLGPILLILPGIIALLPLLGAAFSICLGPIGLIILAIMGIVAIVILVKKHWTEIKAFAEKIWNAIAGFFKKVGEVIKKIFLNMTPVGLIIGHWKEITNFAKETASKIKGFFQGIGDKIGGFFSGMKDKIGKQFDETVAATKSVPDKIAGAFSGMKEKITGHFEGAGKAIVGIMEKMGVDTKGVLDTMKTTFEEKGGGIKGAFCAAFEGMKTAVGGIINKIFGEGATSTLEGWWNSITGWFASLKPSIAWDNIKEGISGAWNTISTKLGDLWSSITGWFSEHKPDLNWEGITTGISNAWDTIKTSLGNLWGSISGWFSEHKPNLSWSGITEGISNIWNDIKTALGNLWDSITGWFRDHKPSFDWFRSGLVPDPSEVWSHMRPVLTEIWDNITNWLDAHVPGWDWTNVTSLLSSSMNTVIDKVNWVVNHINWAVSKINDILDTISMFIPGTLPHIPLIPTIPRLAKGGVITSPTLALLGEAGPEAVVPLGAGTRGAEVTINLSGNTFLGNEAEARRWARLLTKYIREETRGIYGQPAW